MSSADLLERSFGAESVVRSTRSVTATPRARSGSSRHRAGRSGCHGRQWPSRRRGRSGHRSERPPADSSPGDLCARSGVHARGAAFRGVRLRGQAAHRAACHRHVCRQAQFLKGRHQSGVALLEDRLSLNIGYLFEADHYDVSLVLGAARLGAHQAEPQHLLIGSELGAALPAIGLRNTQPRFGRR
jgi:hypothetical protein